MQVHMHKGMRTLGAVLLATALAGCEGLFAPTCLAIISPAIQLRVLDSVTGAVIGTPVQSIARDGAYADTGRTPSNRPDVVPGTFDLAYARAGYYSVSISGAGYREWQRVGIRVSTGECGVNTQRITALLQPAQ